MNMLRPLSMRLCIPCLCLIVALSAECSFDPSQLRALADGAFEVRFVTSGFADAIR